MRLIGLPILSLSLTLLSWQATSIGRDPALVDRFLRDSMGFSTADIDAVKAGRAVAKQMRQRDAVEVNIFGAVRIAASAEAIVQKVRDIEAYERRLGVLQVGKFHDPPQLTDLNALELERSDLTELPRCRPGDCEIQLPADAMTRFRSQINPRTAAAHAETNRLFRQMLFDLLGRYRTGGHRTLPAYVDATPPIVIADEVRLLRGPADLPIDVPPLWQYLSEFPSLPLPGSETFYYWNKGEFGMKPTIRLNHVTIYPTAAPGAHAGVRFIIATSQIYSNHYFSATLELRTIVDDPARPGTGCYLLYTTKSRVTGLTGFMGALLRPMVRSRARSGMERYLMLTKGSVESR